MQNKKKTKNKKKQKTKNKKQNKERTNQACQGSSESDPPRAPRHFAPWRIQWPG